MMYWVIVSILVILIIITTVLTMKGILREHKENREYEKKHRAAAHKKQAEAVKNNPAKSKRAKPAPETSAPAPRKRKVQDKRRRWKIILEDMSSGDVFDYIFYESIGIGRTTQEVAFEDFLSIPYDRRISKVHCAIVMEKDSLCLRDEGSKNHTYLNGKKIQKPVVLQKEDIISIGETDLEVKKILRESN